MTTPDRSRRLRWTRSRALGIGVVSALVLGACGANAPAPLPSGSGPDPFGISGCVWTLSGEGLNQIGLSVELDDPRATADQGSDCTVGFGLEQLEAVGDSACGDTVTGGEYPLSALRGDDRVRLRISSDTNYNDAVDKSAWATLARAILAKLG